MKRKFFIPAGMLLSVLLSARCGKAQSAAPLGLKHAVELAVQNNLSATTAAEKEKAAKGREFQALAALLPDFYASASQSNNTANLAAQGFPTQFLQSFPGLRSPLIGPYDTFDARLHLAQNLFNLSASQRHHAALADLQISSLQTDLAVEQVAAAAEVAYTNALSAQHAVQAAQANLTLAGTLLKLAQDQHRFGKATGVDVARAQTNAANERFSLAQAETAAAQARLALKRLIGIPLDTQLVLTDPLAAKPLSLPAERRLLTQAAQQRLEIRIAGEQVLLQDYDLKAALGEEYPTVDFVANYGESGNTPGMLSLPTRSFGVNMNIPIFNGELTHGDIVQAESAKRQAELSLNDTRVQVEEDVRLALDTLQSTAAEVEAADESANLSERELSLARDRFTAGLSDNVEVVQAQTSLEDARNAQVLALANYNRARINLFAALGEARSIINENF